MSQTKVQLIAPIGVVTASTLETTGVLTATTFVGDIAGTVTGITSTTDNLNLGIVTATSFAGDFTGIGSGLTGTPNVVAGVVTATKFVGNSPGTVSGIADGTNINAGIITATSFVGNLTGNAAGLSTTTGHANLGIVTATSFHGDGSNLTGIAATNWITNNVTANSSTTTVNLSLGNVVKFTQSADTTVSFANTGTSNIVTFVRTQSNSFDTGAVAFDGSGDSLSIPDNADYNFGSGDFTIECWAKVNSINNYNDAFVAQWVSGQYCFYFGTFQQDFRLFWSTDGSAETNLSSGYDIPTGEWHHYAASRSGDSLRLFVDGVQKGSTQDMSGVTLHNSTTTVVLGNNADVGDGSRHLDGSLSNVRIIKGTGLYTSDFSPLMSDLSNVTNTKLLCCQSDSSTTAATVIPSGDSITANGDPTAGSQTISLVGARSLTWPDSIKWNGGSAPTLITDWQSGDANVITLLTRDEGVTWYGWESVSRDIESLTLWGWGNNQYGQLAQNNRTKYSSPVQVGSGDKWAYGGTTEYSLFSKQDGTLWTWGKNEWGQLGLSQSATTYSSSPVQIPGITWASGSYFSVMANPTVGSALKTDGTLWMWGNNYKGKLARPDNAGYSSPVQVPGTTWKTAASVGNYYTQQAAFATKTDGTAWAWGSTAYGQLGLNQSGPGPASVKYSSPVQLPGTTWDRIEQSATETLALGRKTDGTLWVWGYSPNGRFGIPSKATGYYSSPTQIPGTSWSDKFSCTAHTVYAVRTNGTLWAWGSNNQGQLGQNNLTQRSSPTQIPGTTWVNVRSMSNGAVAKKTDGTLWSWGRNLDDGMLGHNNTTDYSSPVQVGSDTTWYRVMQSGGGKVFASKKVY